MFNHLVESGSHANDFKRRSRFFLGTFAFYALMLVALGVGSVFAYNVRVDEGRDYEVSLLRFAPAAQREEIRSSTPRNESSASRSTQFVVRREISINTPYHTNQVASESTREVSARTPVMIGRVSSDPEIPGGVPGPDMSGAGYARNVGVGPAVENSERDDPPPAIKTTPPPVVEKKPPTLLSLGVINGKAISKPVPEYPAIARAGRISGLVTVQILVDEEGRVTSAHVSNGHPLLQQAAVQAAYRARFTPTLLSKQPVKVSGFITYNFTLQ